jgi:hypothetical protein
MATKKKSSSTKIKRVNTKIRSLKQKNKNFKRKITNKYKNKNRVSLNKLKGTIKYKVSKEGLDELKKIDEPSIQKAIKDNIINTKEGVDLIINKFHKKSVTNNFTDYVTNKEIKEIDNKLNSSECVDEISFYDSLQDVMYKGFKCKLLPKGSYLYKAMSGFTTPELENDFIKKQDNFRPLWFGHKYVSYGIAKHNYFGLNVYKVTDDIHLIDFDAEIHTLIKMIHDESKVNQEYKKYLNHIKYISGFEMPLLEQINIFLKEKAHKWGEIWLYTHPEYFKGSYFYCNTPNKRLKLIGLTYNYYVLFFKILELLYPKDLVEGIIIDQQASYLEHNGMFLHEEIILTANIFRNKIKRDTSHPLDWMNWNIKGLDIKDGFIMSDSFAVQTIYDTQLVPNQGFSLVKFWKNNKTKLPKLTDKKYVLSYNVHKFKNIEGQDKPLNDFLTY